MNKYIIAFNKSVVAQKCFEKYLTEKCMAFTFAFISLFLCSCRNNKADVSPSSDAPAEDTLRTITKEMAYEGVNNYCHSVYDLSVANDNPNIMYLQMGEETDSAYQVIFRSHTGAFVHFYVDKASGDTRMVEKVPNLGVEEETGSINILDYLVKK